MLAVLVLVASSCSGGGDGGEDAGSGPAPTAQDFDAESAGAPEPDPAEALANAIRIEDSVAARVGSAVEFASVADPVPVAVGDKVRTDGSGFAEIAYFDGSVTRLDINTELEVIELVDDPGDSIVRTRMGLGRAWNRVQALSGNDTFEVETSVATAVVRGTAFWIVCPSETTCIFAVVEGTLNVVLTDGTIVTLVAPQVLTVEAGEAGDPQPLPFDTGFGDDWLIDNGLRDTTLGFDDPGVIYQQHGPAFASLDGTHEAHGQIDTNTCDSGVAAVCEAVETEFNPGREFDRTYEFVVECDSGGCGGRAVTQWEESGELRSENVRLDHDGSTFSWEHSAPSFQCYGPDGTPLGQSVGSLSWMLTPLSAGVVGNRYLVTDSQVEVEVDYVWTPPFDPFCEESWYSYVLTETLNATRVATNPADSEGVAAPETSEQPDRAPTDYRSLDQTQMEFTGYVCEWAADADRGSHDLEFNLVLSGQTGVWELEDSFSEIGFDNEADLRLRAVEICQQIGWTG